MNTFLGPYNAVSHVVKSCMQIQYLVTFHVRLIFFKIVLSKEELEQKLDRLDNKTNNMNK